MKAPPWRAAGGPSPRPVPRAISGNGVRADATDPKAILEQLQRLREPSRPSCPRPSRPRSTPGHRQGRRHQRQSIGELQAAIDKMNLEAKARALNAGSEAPSARSPPSSGRTPRPSPTGCATASPRARRRSGRAVKAAMSVGSDPDGGYLVPFEVDPTIDRVQPVQGGLYSIANVRTIKGDRYKKLVSQGGATAGWVGETEARTSTSTPTLSEIEIVLGELYVNAPATQQILDDGDVGRLAERRGDDLVRRVRERRLRHRRRHQEAPRPDELHHRGQRLLRLGQRRLHRHRRRRRLRGHQPRTTRCRT
jgi:predicted phage gp36 major capsid-like protein